ncbi:hypothetical protein D7B24_002207 [Verticillium nonalfalfae]|uniref:Uncharacterized protein n=1 Tax=Verticillium nonalfalfae TaxID=1051616 RepID=A0A3M9YG98_9PEZI|nr:uncharacterized protein D7B24_002207 [Verticillium nonalfalfae]RNJ59597.1 hypothetical protein D7B24_002207 [Verticillium nonalfalfae]
MINEIPSLQQQKLDHTIQRSISIQLQHGKQQTQRRPSPIASEGARSTALATIINPSSHFSRPSSHHQHSLHQVRNFIATKRLAPPPPNSQSSPRLRRPLQARARLPHPLHRHSPPHRHPPRHPPAPHPSTEPLPSGPPPNQPDLQSFSLNQLAPLCYRDLALHPSIRALGRRTLERLTHHILLFCERRLTPVLAALAGAGPVILQPIPLVTNDVAAEGEGLGHSFVPGRGMPRDRVTGGSAARHTLCRGRLAGHGVFRARVSGD